MSFDSSAPAVTPHAPPADRPVLEFAQAGKTYPPQRTPLRQLWSHVRGHGRSGQGGFTALSPVDFSIYRGQSVGIVGLNGAGKSTLLQLAAGTLTPSQGKVRSHGRIAALLELGSGFNPEATGRENIFLYAATLGLTREQVAQQLESIIAFSGLVDALDMPVKTYSSGMQVRLAFAVATAVEPDILIVDEALSVGDGVFAKRSFDRVMQLREQGTALLLCSHALFHIDLFCQRTLWLDKGQIRAFGPTADVLPQYKDYVDTLNGGGSQVGQFSPSTQASPSNAPADTAPSAEASQDGSGHDPAVAVDGQQPDPHVASLEGTENARHPSTVRLLRAQVSLDGQVGTRLQGRSLHSTLQVDVWLQVSHEEPQPRAAIVLSSESGKIIGSCMSEPDAIVAQDAQGHASIRYTWAQLPINRGQYRVGVYLLSANGHYVYEWVDPLAVFQLEHSGIHQGPWLLPGQWSGLE